MSFSHAMPAYTTGSLSLGASAVRFMERMADKYPAIFKGGAGVSAKVKLTRADVEKPRLVKMSPALCERVVALWRIEKNITRIAHQVGYSPASVSKVLVARGLHTPKSQPWHTRKI